MNTWLQTSDPYQYLEDLHSGESLAWVAGQNLRTSTAWQRGARFEQLRQRLTQAYLPHEPAVIPQRQGDWAYDFLQDELHPRGLWRRTRWAQWRAGQPQWQNLIDIGQLNRVESAAWVWLDAQLLVPDGDRALVMLSPGGSDALIVREFDVDHGCFVADGFHVEIAGHHNIGWIDRNTVYLAWDDGESAPGRTGFPYLVRRWSRDEQLSDAPVIFRGEFTDDAVSAWYDPIDKRHMAVRHVDSFDQYTYHRDAAGQWSRYELPAHVHVDVWGRWLILSLRCDFDCADVRYVSGSVLIIAESAFLAGERCFVPIFTSTQTTSAAVWSNTRHYLLLSYLDDLASRILLCRPVPSLAEEWCWEVSSLAIPKDAHIQISPIAPELNDEVYITTVGYLSPWACWFADLAAPAGSEWQLLDRRPAYFDASRFAIKSCHAVAPDGTRIPYTMIGLREHLQGAGSGPVPCLLTGYGGFGISMAPHYLTGPGIAWLEGGGVYVVAHIRGGGEYGAKWHQAAIGKYRQRAFDDFIAVAQSLIDTAVTRGDQLGIQGSSNGGLLVAACMLQRPDLFGAVVCDGALLDMHRYPLLHIGAAWIEEYGDPEQPQHAAILSSYSPYHCATAEIACSPILFTASINDDRVHPAHSRKMVARLQELQHTRVWYLEKADGGHGMTDALQAAKYDATVFSFLWAQLGG